MGNHILCNSSEQVHYTETVMYLFTRTATRLFYNVFVRFPPKVDSQCQTTRDESPLRHKVHLKEQIHTGRFTYTTKHPDIKLKCKNYSKTTNKNKQTKRESNYRIPGKNDTPVN